LTSLSLSSAEKSFSAEERERERERGGGARREAKFKLKANKVRRNRKFPSTTNAERSDGYIKVRKVTQIFDELCGLREKARKNHA